MAFVKFTETGKSNVPKASINARGNISFSDGARRRFGMDRYSHVVLYYDSEEKQIGVELCTTEPDEAGIKLRMRKSGGATMGAKPFVDFFDLNIQRTTIFDVRVGGMPNWLIIDLKTARERNTKDDKDMGEEDELNP